MRDFEHRTAYAFGILLPALETARRRTDFTTIAGYVDDFLVGGILLAAAFLVSRAHPTGRAALVAAWGILCGGLYNSFFGQLESGSATDVSGLPAIVVIAIKGTVYAAAICCLYLSVRRVSGPR